MRSRVKSSAGVVFGRIRAQVSDGSYIGSLSPAAWYRYNQGITSAGGFVSAWDDQSGNARHLLQATGTNQPSLEADGSITFDGVDNFMRVIFAITQPVTCYVVWRGNTAVANARIVDGATNGTTFSYLRWGAGGTNTLANAGNPAGALTTAAGASWMVDFTVVNSVSTYHGRDSGVDASANDAGANNPGGITLGANTTTSPGNFGASSIREVIVFPEAHEEDVRSRIIKYLLPLAA